MTEAKFTKGPWFAREYVSPSDTWFVRSESGGNVTGQAGGKMNEANAHLIAAAPELYEALEETRRLVSLASEDGFSDHDLLRDLFVNNATITRALRKARGEQ